MAQHETSVDMRARLVRTALRGVFDLDDITAWSDAYRTATDRFRGKNHIVLADMRGMKTMKAEVAEAFGDTIGYARARGAVLCAHVSDETVQRLQAKRIARESSPSDDVTVDVDSLEEAERVCAEALDGLDDAEPVSALREL